MSARILDSIILKTLENFLKVQSYNGVRDPDEHVDHIDDRLDYSHANGLMKCKIFVLTLIVSVMTWFKSLQDGSIYSWSDLCEAFNTDFTTRKMQPTTTTMLSGIMQGKKETMCGYIDHFTKVVIVVGGSNEIMNCCIFKKGLRPNCAFREKLEIKEAHNRKALLSRVQPYIINEEKLLANRVSRVPGSTRPSRPLENDFRRFKEENEYGSCSKFDAYTPLST